MLVLFLSFILGVTEVFGTTCLKCDDVPLPNLCNEVIECGSHELCSTEAFVSASGSLRYRLGCIDKQSCHSQNALGRRDVNDDILTCLSCCTDDICNAAACGSTGFSDQFGPVCYTCHLQLGVSTCNKISLCDTTEMCGIHHVVKVGAPDNLFETKCFSTNECHSVTANNEFSCCNDTLCNNNDPRVITTQTTPMVTTPPPPTTPPPSTTQTPSTTPTPSTTQPTTARPTTVKVCEDKVDAICYPETCHLQLPYLVENCTKTCGFCKTGSSTTQPLITKSPTTSQSQTTSQTTTTTSRPTTSTIWHRPTTQATHMSVRPDAVYDLYCEDIIVGCLTYVDYCHTSVDWAKINCRKSCGYCYSDPATIIG